MKRLPSSIWYAPAWEARWDLASLVVELDPRGLLKRERASEAIDAKRYFRRCQQILLQAKQLARQVEAASRLLAQPEAEIAKSALQSAGIDAMIKADTAGGMRPHLAWSGGGFQVLVREEDVGEAKEVLEGWASA